jgi:hypothetical protein
MKHVLPYALFEASATAPALTQEQIGWLDKCAAGRWKLNTSTGLIDVDVNFDCREQGLTDLKGVKFGDVSGNFDCEDNELTSLEGAPQSVGGGFWCNGNQLTTLEGAPQTVDGSFSCKRNELTTLEGAPQSVKGNFVCSGNGLTTLEGAPQTVGGDFYCEGNPVSESTLKAIFALMKSGMGYQQALEEHWPEMEDEDRAVLYKQMTDLSPEDERKYKALATYNNIKNYL